MLQVQDLQEAETVIIKSIQCNTFPEELKLLKSSQHVKLLDDRLAAPAEIKFSPKQYVLAATLEMLHSGLKSSSL